MVIVEVSPGPDTARVGMRFPIPPMTGILKVFAVPTVAFRFCEEEVKPAGFRTRIVVVSYPRFPRESVAVMIAV